MFLSLDKIPTDLGILQVNVIICSAKFNFSSIVMPIYFTDLLTKTGFLLKSISIVWIGLVILGVNINAEDFLGLAVILLAFVHSSRLSNSWLTSNLPLKCHFFNLSANKFQIFRDPFEGGP